MRKHYVFMVIGLVLLIAAGIGVYLWRSTGGIPDDPDQIILFSIDGMQSGEVNPKRTLQAGQELLFDYPVLGKIEIGDPDLRRKVISAIKADIRSGANGSKCFWPRHVLRVVKGGKTIDLVICFECHNFELHKNGEPHRGNTPPIGESSKTLLNEILTDAAITIALPPL